MTQPLHCTDPTYHNKLSGDIGTRGGNEIKFITPIKINVWHSQPIEISELHFLWDAMAGVCDQLPYQRGDLSTTKDQQDYLKVLCRDKKKGELVYDVQHSQNIRAIDGSKIDFLTLQSNLDNDADVSNWAADTYEQAKLFAIKNLGLKTVEPVPNPRRPGTFMFIIDTPHAAYQDLVKDISEIQIYKAGIRLANLLNAIYDPYSTKTHPAYEKFVRTLVQSGKYETLDQLCHVDVIFALSDKYKLHSIVKCNTFKI